MKIMLFFLLILMAHAQLYAQWKLCNLSSFYQQSRLETYNRNVGILEDDMENGITIAEKDGEGVVWLKDVSFEEGVIEVDLKGKDVFQKSFLGIAFQGIDNTSYEAVYFRPFNFSAADSIRRNHAVQYISHPSYTWKVLRDQYNGKFENGVRTELAGDKWFHARIEVNGKLVSVYLNNASQPALVVKKLGATQGRKLGLWVGDGSGGVFSNLKIKKI